MPLHFWNSMLITIPAIVLILLFASAVAFVVSRFSFWFNVPLLIFFMAANLLPQQVIITPVYEMYLRIHLPTWLSGSGLAYDSFIGLIAINVAFQTGFCTFVLSNYMKTLPKSLSEAARVDGAGVTRQYFGIILPLCKPAFAALAVLEFTWIYNDFFWAIVLMSSGDKRPITTSLAEPLGPVLHRQQPDRRRVGARRAADHHGVRATAAAVHQRPHAGVDEGVAVARVAFIGAGSVVFTKNLLGDILSFPELRGVEIALHDIDPDRLATAEAMARHVAREREASPAISVHVERRAALDGADYVINMVQVGGHAATLLDFEIPARHGVRQTIADTLGIGGIFRALRTADHMLALGCEMAELCPRAWLLNYTNPMAMLCWLVYGGTPTQNVVGLCHSVQFTTEDLAAVVGVPVDEVTFLAAGLNHQAFILRFERDGEDLYPLLDARIESDPELQRRVRVQLYRRLGYFPTESSEHAAEYVPWFMSHDDEIERHRIPVAEYIHRSEENLLEYERVKGMLERGEADAAREVERVRGVDHPLDGDRGRRRSSTGTCATRGSCGGSPTTAASRCRASSMPAASIPCRSSTTRPSSPLSTGPSRTPSSSPCAPCSRGDPSSFVRQRCSTRTPRRRSRSTRSTPSATS